MMSIIEFDKIKAQKDDQLVERIREFDDYYEYFYS